MNIILSRHGNTFNPGEQTVWVGSTSDLPLVEAGLQQAKRLGQFLKKTGVTPTAIYCGPLKRTTVYAQVVLNELTLPLQPIIDSRLNEINYGDWTGLTTEQIRLKFGTEAVEGWEKYSQWPNTGAWQASAQTLINEIESFSQDLTKNQALDATILIISSNGRLRYFLDLVPGEFQHHIEQQNFKVATGNICKLTYANKVWALNFWNQIPAVGLKIT